MMSALSSDSSASTQTFRSSSSTFRSMVGELDKRARVWRVEAPMGMAVACILEPRQLAAVCLRAFPYFTNFFTMLDGFNDRYFHGKALTFSSSSSGEHS